MLINQAIGTGAETLVACARAEKILLLEERQERRESKDLPKGTVSFKGFSGKWTKVISYNY